MREWQSLLKVLHVYAVCWTELTQSFLRAHLSVAACVGFSSPVLRGAWSRLLSIVTDQLRGFPRSLCQYPQPSFHASQRLGIAAVGVQCVYFQRPAHHTVSL